MITGTAIPTLFKYVTPEYASNWKRIGVLLGMSVGALNAIERSFPTNANWCCERMFETLFQMDTPLTWNKVFSAIDSCTPGSESVATSGQSKNIVSIRSNHGYTVLQYFICYIATVV